MKIHIISGDICTCCGKMSQMRLGIYLRTDGRRSDQLEIFICDLCALDAITKVLKKDKRKKGG
jgi:hypothetical protein